MAEAQRELRAVKAEKLPVAAGPLSRLGENRKLVLAFVAAFSRFEFALKHGGYLLKEADGADASADWNTFADDIDKDFLKGGASFDRAVGRIRGEPPRKQVAQRREPEFRAAGSPNSPTARNILTHVRRARNNLFHGGKFSGAPKGTERDASLLEDSLVILNRALEVSPKAVGDAFQEWG